MKRSAMVAIVGLGYAKRGARGRPRKYSKHPTLLGAIPPNKRWGMVDGKPALVSKAAGRTKGVSQKFSDDVIAWLADRVRMHQQAAATAGAPISVRRALEIDAFEHYRRAGRSRHFSEAEAKKLAARYSKLLRRRATDLFGV